MKLLIAPGSKPFKRLLLFSVISVVLIGAQFFVWSWVRTLATQWKQNRSQEQQVAELSRRLETIKNEYAQEQGSFVQLNVLTPHAGQTPELVSQLEKLAETNNVTETTQTISEGAPGDPQPLDVAVQAKGRATSLLHYIKAIEQLPELVAIPTWALNLDPAAATSASPATPLAPSYTLDMTVVFFLQP